MKKEIQKLRYTPEEIEGALRHCTTQEQCAGCPLLRPGGSEYCGHVLDVEAFKYIELLKYQNKTLAQRVEELEGGGV